MSPDRTQLRHRLTRRLKRASLACALALAVIYAGLHVVSLAGVFVGRAGYAYDVEWMEGGQLVHALRVMHGEPLYGDCSDGWISFAYPPVHAWALAIVGWIFGLDYLSGRMLSVAAFAVSCTLLLREVARSCRDRWLGGALGALALGSICALYPYSGAWYDVIRVDSLYLALLFGGTVASLPPLPAAGAGARVGLSGGRILLAATLLTLAVLTKQTAALFLPWICLHALWRHPRSGLRLGLTTAAAVFGTLLLISLATEWRFYQLVFGVMSKHPLIPRQLASNVVLTWRFAPYVFALPLFGIALKRRRRLRSRSAFWLGMLLNAMLISFITAAKVGAFLNNLMSLAMLAGPVAAMLWGDWLSALSRRRGARALISIALCAFAVWNFDKTRYDNRIHIPSANDRARAQALNRTIAELGEVTMPSHPFLPVRNGSRARQIHEQAYIDVMGAGGVGIDVVACFSAIRSPRLVLDNVSQSHFVWLAELGYRHDRELPADTRVMAGFYTVPNRILKRDGRAPLYAPRQRSRLLFDFEAPDYDGWQRDGEAFAAGTSVSHNGYQPPVGGHHGARFANSFHPEAGDAAVGRIISPPFVIDRSHLGFRVAGGALIGLEVALWVDGVAVRRAYQAGRNTGLLGPVVWDVSPWRGKTAVLHIADAERGPWGWIAVDAVELFDAAP